MHSAPQVFSPSFSSFPSSSFSSQRKDLSSVTTSNFSHSVTWVKFTMKTTVPVGTFLQKAFHYFALWRRENRESRVGVSQKMKATRFVFWAAEPMLHGNQWCLNLCSDGMTWLWFSISNGRLLSKTEGEQQDVTVDSAMYPQTLVRHLKSCTHISYSYSKTCEVTLTLVWEAYGISLLFSTQDPPAGHAVHSVNWPLWL